MICLADVFWINSALNGSTIGLMYSWRNSWYQRSTPPSMHTYKKMMLILSHSMFLKHFATSWIWTLCWYSVHDNIITMLAWYKCWKLEMDQKESTWPYLLEQVARKCNWNPHTIVEFHLSIWCCGELVQVLIGELSNIFCDVLLRHCMVPSQPVACLFSSRFRGFLAEEDLFARILHVPHPQPSVDPYKMEKINITYLTWNNTKKLSVVFLGKN